MSSSLEQTSLLFCQFTELYATSCVRSVSHPIVKGLRGVQTHTTTSSCWSSSQGAVEEGQSCRIFCISLCCIVCCGISRQHAVVTAKEFKLRTIPSLREFKSLFHFARLDAVDVLVGVLAPRRRNEVKSSSTRGVRIPNRSAVKPGKKSKEYFKSFTKSLKAYRKSFYSL